MLPLSETIGKLKPLLPAMGITRVAEITGLDYIGIPVALSIRPASLGLSVQQGKGVSRDAAFASALMESVESFAAEQRSPHRTQLRSGEQDGMLAPPAYTLRQPVPADAILTYVPAENLLDGGNLLVPEDLVRFDVSLPRPTSAAWVGSSTSGLAAGNTRDEAILHAVCELIERDGCARWRALQQADRQATAFDPWTVEDPAVYWLLERLEAARMAFQVWDVTSEFGVPAFLCTIDDRNTDRSYLGCNQGAGCHPSAGVALCRSLSEAAQSRLTGIAGSRDDMDPARYLVSEWDRALSQLLHDSAPPIAGRAAPRATSFDSSTVDQDLAAVLGRLRSASITTVACIDMTDLAFGIPCVRVVAPELAR